MYSPRIDAGLIPILYRIGKARDIPMTRLVDQMLFEALERTEIPAEAMPQFQQAALRYHNLNNRKEAA